MKLRLLLAVLTGMLLFSAPLYADPPLPLPQGEDVDTEVPTISLEDCTNENFDDGAYTTKVVHCVKEKIEDATITILTELSDYMSFTVGVAFIYAVILFGIRIVGGQQQLNGQTMGFLLRLGLVFMFSYNLGGYAGDVFDIMEEITTLVSGNYEVVNGSYQYIDGPYSPWETIDEYLARPFGFGTEFTLAQGLVGLIGASLFSANMGGTIFAAGLALIWALLKFVFDVVYMYLSAVLMVGFMIIISPLIIPLALFYHTERFFKKWLDILVGAIITPALLFAFLSLTLGGFLSLISDIYSNMTDPNNPDFSPYWRISQSISSPWIMPADPNFAQRLAQQNGTTQSVAPIGGSISPFEHSSFSANMFMPPGINLGGDQQLTNAIVYSFISLLIYVMLITNMVQQIPGIAASIAGTSVGVTLQNTGFREKMREAKNNAFIGAGIGLGGGAGSAVAGAVSNSTRTREAGAIVGGVMGALVGNRL